MKKHIIFSIFLIDVTICLSDNLMAAEFDQAHLEHAKKLQHESLKLHCGTCWEKIKGLS